MRNIYTITTFVLFRGMISSKGVKLLPHHDESHLAKCISTIVNHHFLTEKSIHISIPKLNIENQGSLIVNQSSQYYQNKLEKILLGNIIEDYPLEISYHGGPTPGNIRHNDFVRRNGYIIFVWPSDEEDMLYSLIEQIEEIQYGLSWNPRARFLVVAVMNDVTFGPSLALSMLKELWDNYEVLDADVLICPDESSSLEEPVLFKIYTWFPYISTEHCDQVKQVVLIEKWDCLKDEFILGTSLYQNKIPKNLLECPFRVSTSEVPLQVILTAKYVDENNQTVYNFTGLEILIVQTIAHKLNLTLKYSLEIGDDHILTHQDMITNVHDGKSDIAVSAYPLYGIVLGLVDPTISYFPCYVRWYVPCGRSMPRMDKIINIFTLSTWGVMGFLIFCVILVIWWLAKTTNRHLLKESKAYQTITYIFYNIFAVVFGVSVTEMPRTSRVRALFSLWVWYCFAISTVFQVFFTTFLVDPGIQETITTLEQLLNSGLKYARNFNWDDFIKMTSEDYHSSIRSIEKVDCEDYECYEYVLNSTNFVTVSSSPLFENFISKSLHTINLPICEMPEDIFRMETVMYMRVGNPLLKHFNFIIRILLESGLLDKIRVDLKMKLRAESISSQYEIEESGEIEYFVFSTAHLIFSFYILGVGYVMSSIVFITEVLYTANSEMVFEKPAMATEAMKIIPRRTRFTRFNPVLRHYTS